MKNVTVCTFKTSPFVPAPRAHMFQHVCAGCRYTRGRFERTHGDALSGHTAPHTTPHHADTPKHHTETETETETETDKERREDGRAETRQEKRRQKKTRQEKREDSFSVWWCMAVLCWCSDFLVDSVCARDFSLLNSVKYDSFSVFF